MATLAPDLARAIKPAGRRLWPSSCSRQAARVSGHNGPAKAGHHDRAYVVSAFKSLGTNHVNAENAEAAEKKCPRISLRAQRALRSNVAFFHKLFRRTGAPAA